MAAGPPPPAGRDRGNGRVVGWTNSGAGAKAREGGGGGGGDSCWHHPTARRTWRVGEGSEEGWGNLLRRCRCSMRS